MKRQQQVTGSAAAPFISHRNLPRTDSLLSTSAAGGNTIKLLLPECLSKCRRFQRRSFSIGITLTTSTEMDSSSQLDSFHERGVDKLAIGLLLLFLQSWIFVSITVKLNLKPKTFDECFYGHPVNSLLVLFSLSTLVVLDFRFQSDPPSVPNRILEDVHHWMVAMLRWHGDDDNVDDGVT